MEQSPIEDGPTPSLSLRQRQRQVKVTLFCLVVGDSLENVFCVATCKYTPVAMLKDLIKVKKQARFAGVDADQLTLWEVNIPHHEFTELSIATLQERGIKMSPFAE